MTPVRLEPAALWSRVKHSTTEPLRSLRMVVKMFQCIFHVQNIHQDCNNLLTYVLKVHNANTIFYNDVCVRACVCARACVRACVCVCELDTVLRFKGI